MRGVLSYVQTGRTALSALPRVPGQDVDASGGAVAERLQELWRQLRFMFMRMSLRVHNV